MAKIFSTLTDGFSNETVLKVVFINGVGWAGDETILLQMESWYGYHVDRSTDDRPDVLDTVTKDEISALCYQYRIDMTGKSKWVIIAELRAAIATDVPLTNQFNYSYDLNKWLEERKLD